MIINQLISMKGVLPDYKISEETKMHLKELLDLIDSAIDRKLDERPLLS